ncbi:DUF924 family protein [Amphritea sp. 1_MG-2023]|uniref:DUF924 family protein n=1 Tax=Amphritea sp. 1_MG-2023 TaxID=3062670 RepID=UPI0026E41449|nr:DUF924 family protein [Amphritea sp. 1_MG-2023]MDO6562185.1 DUF924 family protein [Amphritea sp. 1_MG-2023]
MTEQIEEILQFWFGELQQGFPVTHRKSLWWFGDEAIDRQLEELFGYRVRQALRGQLDDWAGQPRGRLALIILLDQFTRSIYRGSAEAFSGDDKAEQLCREGLKKGHDAALEGSEKLFFLMPLEHAEDVAAQNLCIAQLDNILCETPMALRHHIDNALDFAHEHRNLIVRFGRFPYRNKILGRSSTPEELAYLNQPHKRYGQ